jgi:hypothetical protein
VVASPGTPGETATKLIPPAHRCNTVWSLSDRPTTSGEPKIFVTNPLGQYLPGASPPRVDVNAAAASRCKKDGRADSLPISR